MTSLTKSRPTRKDCFQNADPRSKRRSPLKEAIRNFNGSTIEVELPFICEHLRCNANVYFYHSPTDGYELDFTYRIEEETDDARNLLNILKEDGNPILNEDSSCSFHIVAMENVEEAIRMIDFIKSASA